MLYENLAENTVVKAGQEKAKGKQNPLIKKLR